VMPDLVLSVPEPDIFLHFLIQRVRILNQVPNKVLQHLIEGCLRLPVWENFSSKIIGLEMLPNVLSKSQPALANRGLPALRFRIRYQSQPKRTS
jgi:hypothetical protein